MKFQPQLTGKDVVDGVRFIFVFRDFGDTLRKKVKQLVYSVDAIETYGAPLLRALKAFTFSFMSAIVSLSVLINVLHVALSITAFSLRFTFSASVFSRALFTDTFYQLENEFTNTR